MQRKTKIYVNLLKEGKTFLEPCVERNRCKVWKICFSDGTWVSDSEGAYRNLLTKSEWRKTSMCLILYETEGNECNSHLG